MKNGLNMPTPEEIKNLSAAYAEYMCPVGDYCSGVYDDQRNTYLSIYKDDAKSVLEWLSKDFVIVPKSKVKIEYKKSYSAAFEPTTCLDRQYARGRYQVLRELFGKSLFNEEKE